jgi:DNA-binding FadR family transcriptional regulator
MKEIFNTSMKRPSAVDIVIDAIKDGLITKKLKPGDLLPDQTSLAEQLNVSRGSVREAMKILDAYGIVDVRRGEGTYICSKPTPYMFNPLLFQILVNDAEVDSIVEVRRDIEAIIIKMVIEKATDEELQLLEAETKRFSEELNKGDKADYKTACELDIRFHRLTAKLCKNVIFENIYNFIIDLFEPHIHPFTPGVKENHENLTKEIVARDLPAAMRELNKHNEHWHDNL